MAIYDCFTLFNEIELLKFRVKYLKDVVDYFVIIEASETHSGKPKTQNFSYDFFDEDVKSKIRYAYIDFPKEDLLDYLDFNADYMLQTKDSWECWARENYQRNYIKKCLTNASENDIILISDIDEIFYADAIEYLKKNASELEKNFIVSLIQMPFYYSIHNPWMISPEEKTDWWFHPKATLKKNMIRPNLTRMGKPDTTLNIGGWHFGYFGGGDRIKVKKESVATHSEELSKEQEKVSKNINNRDSIINNISKIPREILETEFRIPSLVFSEEFIDFFTGGVI
jgi:beta-1,4-mannosyl-glycoprotein beta-1,4-N-acetylglucosaminyltransferase